MRKFKHFHRQVSPLRLLTPLAFELGEQPALSAAQIGLLGGERVGLNLIEQPQIEQSLLLLTDAGQLALQTFPFRRGGLLGHFRLGPQHADNPAAHFVIFDPQPSKQRQDLLVECCLSDADPRMIPAAISRAAIIAVFAQSRAGLLLLDFHNDRPAAMTAADHASAIDRIARMVSLLPQQQLHPLKRLWIDNRLVLARMPMPMMLDFTNVGPIAQDRMELTACKRRLLAGVLQALLGQLFRQAVERMTVVGVEFKHTPDNRSRPWLDDHQAPALLPTVGVAVGSFTNKQPILYTPRQPLAHIDALLLSVKRRHIGQNAPLHSARGSVFRRLSHVKGRHAIFRFQSLHFHVVEQIPRRPVNFVKQHAVELIRVLAGEFQQLPKRPSLLPLAGRLGQPVQFDDFAAYTLGVSLKRRLLHFQGKTLPLLFPARHPRQRDKLFHSDDSSIASIRRPTLSNIPKTSPSVNSRP